MYLPSILESILFVASKPLTIKQLIRALSVDESHIKDAIETLKVKHNSDTSGMRILETGDTLQLATASENAEYIDQFVKDEVAGELTKAQLETLTVIAYVGPISRPELEEIRGVNCAIIIRNLLMRNLILEEDGDIVPRFRLSPEALAHLGVTSVEMLPEYEALRHHPHLNTEAAPEV